jgi:hypothetical protein
MTIEKTFKLTIKATSFYLNATEINALYNECGKALNIGNTNPSYPPGVTKQPSDYPSWPTGYPFGTTTDYPSQYCHSDMTTDNFEFDSNTSLNPKSSKGINFIKDDMTTIKDNNNWRSSVQKSLDKLSAKTNITTNDGTNDGTKVG